MKPNRVFCFLSALVLATAGCRDKPSAVTEPNESAERKISLHTAVRKNNVQLAESLIEGGADVNAKDEAGKTLLHWASVWDHRAVAKVLLAQGADVDAKDRKGDTPLHDAARRGHAEIVELLGKHGAEE